MYYLAFPKNVECSFGYIANKNKMRNKEYPTVGTVPKEYPGPPGVGLSGQSQNLIKTKSKKKANSISPIQIHDL